MPSFPLLLKVARNLRYRPVQNLLQKQITIPNRAQVETATTTFATQFAPASRLNKPEQKYIDRQIAKYAILDICFQISPAQLETNYQAGVPLLRQLKLVSDDPAPEPILESQKSIWEMLWEDICKNEAYLLLFLRDLDPAVRALPVAERLARLEDPARIQWPITFTVVDACVTNSPLVWINKHFYL